MTNQGKIPPIDLHFILKNQVWKIDLHLIFESQVWKIKLDESYSSSYLLPKNYQQRQQKLGTFLENKSTLKIIAIKNYRISISAPKMWIL